MQTISGIYFFFLPVTLFGKYLWTVALKNQNESNALNKSCSLTSTVGESARVRWSQIVDVEISATVLNVCVERLRATAVDVKKIYTGLDRHFCIIFRVRSLQPNRSYSAAMPWIYHWCRHLSSYVAGETIPSPRKNPITQCYLACHPLTLNTASWLVNFNVFSGVAAFIALGLMGLPKSRKSKSKPKYKINGKMHCTDSGMNCRSRLLALTLWLSRKYDAKILPFKFISLVIGTKPAINNDTDVHPVKYRSLRIHFDVTLTVFAFSMLSYLITEKKNVVIYILPNSLKPISLLTNAFLCYISLSRNGSHKKAEATEEWEDVKQLKKVSWSITLFHRRQTPRTVSRKIIANK